MANRFPLSEHQERAFRSWYKKRAKKFGLNPDPDNSRQKYDYRAAYVTGAEPDSTGHWPSEFKDPSHPRWKVHGRVVGSKRARG